MENRLDRERRERRKAYQRAKQHAVARREATEAWLKRFRPALASIARTFRLKLSKHPGRFLLRDGEVDVASVWWSGRASVRWHGEEDAALANALAELIREHPKGAS